MSFNRPNQNYFGSSDQNTNRMNQINPFNISMNQNNQINSNQNPGINNMIGMNGPVNPQSHFPQMQQVNSFNQLNQGVQPQGTLQSNNFLQRPQQNTKVTGQGTRILGNHYQKKILEEFLEGRTNTSKFVSVSALDDFTGYSIEELRYIDFKLNRGQVVNLPPAGITVKAVSTGNMGSIGNISNTTNNFINKNQNLNQISNNPLYRGASTTTTTTPSTSTLNEFNKYLNPTTSITSNNNLTSTTKFGANNTWNSGMNNPLNNSLSNNTNNNLTNNFTSNLSNNNINGGMGSNQTYTMGNANLSSTNPFNKSNLINNGIIGNINSPSISAYGGTNQSNINNFNSISNSNTYGINNNQMQTNSSNMGNINTYGGLNKQGSVTFNSSYGLGALNQGYTNNQTNVNYPNNTGITASLNNSIRSPTNYSSIPGNSLSTSNTNNLNPFNKGMNIGMGTNYASNNNPLSGLGNVNSNTHNAFNPFAATSPRGVMSTNIDPFQNNQNIRPGNITFSSSSNVGNSNPFQGGSSVLNSSNKIPFPSSPSYGNNNLSLSMNTNNIMIPNSFKQPGLVAGSSNNNSFLNSMNPSPFQLRPQNFMSVPGNITFTNPQGQNKMLNHQQMSLNVNQVMNNKLFPQFNDYLGIEAMKNKINHQKKNMQNLSSKEIEEILNFDSLDKRKENEFKDYNSLNNANNYMNSLGNYNSGNLQLNGFKTDKRGNNLDNISISTFNSNFKPNFNENNIPAFGLTAKPESNYKFISNNNLPANNYLTANKPSNNNVPYSYSSTYNNINNSNNANPIQNSSIKANPFNLYFSKPENTSNDETGNRLSLTEVKPNVNIIGSVNANNKDTMSLTTKNYYKSAEYFEEIERLSNEAQKKVLGYIPGSAGNINNSNNLVNPNLEMKKEINNNFSTIKKELISGSNTGTSIQNVSNMSNIFNSQNTGNVFTFAHNKNLNMNTIPEVIETQSALHTPVMLRDENIINSEVHPNLYQTPLSGFDFSEKKKPLNPSNISHTKRKSNLKREDDLILNLKFEIKNPVCFKFNVKINKRNKVKDLRMAIEEILKENHPIEFKNVDTDRYEILTKTGILKDTDVIETKEFINEKETLLILINSSVSNFVRAGENNDGDEQVEFVISDVSPIKSSKSFNSFNPDGTNNHITNINKFPNNLSGFIEYVPKTKKYQTVPALKDLNNMTREELEKVQNFTIFNKFARIIFKGYTDVTYLNLDEIVTLEELYVNVYDRISPPEENEKLNKESRIFIYHFECDEYQESDEDFADFIENIKRNLHEKNAKFINYDPKLQQLVFDVPNFNRK